ncbi:MAG: winged helix-turn-helix transcriptional regulator [Sandaracinus sp.]|nr:winged helix-turn-helix transcriptional regulator [Sandaracinus sp.]MCB9613342.1 winged helix-turn-helix transcriptional regulator [Sandaracinus sp.]MCB9632171.1 winged helix-turn-helix transcriptional regulator [Sandaracinus sp.]
MDVCIHVHTLSSLGVLRLVRAPRSTNHLRVSDAKRQRAAADIAALLDTPLLRALAEPARLEVLKVLLVHGRGDVASIAEHLPQDRSVVSRHLQTLEDAGVVRSTREGRHRLYEIEGDFLVERFDFLAARMRQLSSICCPPVTDTKKKRA